MTRHLFVQSLRADLEVASVLLVVDGKPPQGLSRETTIRRDAEGRWYHEGDPVTNPAVARAFDAWVDFAEDGRYCLRNAVNWAYVEIEGTPLFVNRVWMDKERPLVKLSDGRLEELQLSTLRYDREGQLFCSARDGRMTALFRRRAMLDLVEWIDEDDEGMFILAGEQKVRPPEVEDPMKALEVV